MTTKAYIVVGLGYGDEGKGAVVDHLTREKDAVAIMRFSGGSQAAHNVITPDGRHHTFAQFGSGTFVPDVETYLGPGMMVNPLDMFNEYYHLSSLGEGDAWDRMVVHSESLITTPIHAAVNRMREKSRGDNAHGTTGKGIGETRWAMDNFAGGALIAGELTDPELTRIRLRKLCDDYRANLDHLVIFERRDGDEDDEDVDLIAGRRPDLIELMVDRYAEWASRTRIVDNDYLSLLLKRGVVILEGSQGALLDECHGFHPHTTWAPLLADTARAELGRAGLKENEVHTIGVTRAYSTRHGAGPFPPSQDRGRGGGGHSNASYTLSRRVNEPDNHDDGFPGKFVIGPFDAITFKYAIGLNRPDSIAVTHLDVFPTIDGDGKPSGDIWPIIDAYRYRGTDELSPYLVTENGIVTEINPSPSEGYTESLAWMECVGRRLFKCWGWPHDSSPITIVSKIEELAGVPVSITGRGPSSPNYETIVGTL